MRDHGRCDTREVLGRGGGAMAGRVEGRPGSAGRADHPGAAAEPPHTPPRSLLRRAFGVAAWTIAGSLALGLASIVVVVFAFVLGGGYGDRFEPPGPPPLDQYAVYVSGGYAGEGPRELTLDPRDVAALGVQGSIVAESGDELGIATALTRGTTGQQGYCLAAGAAVVEVDGGATVATIPAGTCLGPNTLRVPTAFDPDVGADPERWHGALGSIGVPLAGFLDVGIDGCASLDGIRLIWPENTTIGDSGAIELPDGSTFDDGVMATLIVVHDASTALEPDGWCAPDAAVAFVTGTLPA
jgi:hypothetical protein